MSFQAYIDNIKAKTGKEPDDFKRLAAEKGLAKDGALMAGIKAGDIIAWLKKDFDLGHGHAMAIYALLSSKKTDAPKEDRVGGYFTGVRSNWREAFEQLLDQIKKFGNDINVSATDTYLSILRGERKIAIVQAYKDRMDVGIKLKNAAHTDRFTTAGTWNVMVTHRVQITSAEQFDEELFEWLRKAYEQNS